MDDKLEQSTPLIYSRCHISVRSLLNLVLLSVALIALTAACGESESASLDRDALVALYNSTDGPNWTNNANWLTDVELGQWHGVATFRGRVIALELRLNQLRGEIPPELGSLARLQVLDLRTNDLSGEIPSGFGELASLTGLALQGNRLSGRYHPNSAVSGS